MKLQLDNSAFSILSCERKFQLRVLEGKLEGKNTAASFGDAVHKGLQYLDEGFSPDEMFEKLTSLHGIDLPKVLSLITFYKTIERKLPPILINNRPAIEFKFSHTYARQILPGHSEPLEIDLVGTVDIIGLDNGILVIRDYKTTEAATTYMLDQKLATYAMSFQLPFYFFALLTFGILPAEYLSLLEQNKYRMEIHLLAYNTNPPTLKKLIKQPFNAEFVSREIPMIVNSKIQEALHIAQLQSHAPRTGMTVYKACDYCGFRPACLIAGSAKEEEILSRYPIAPYEPLSFR